MLKHLDKFINKYVCCQKCNFPELRMKIEGKDLQSTCNSCGQLNKHDSTHKAGKVFMNMFKTGGKQKEDIVKKDAKQANAAEADDSGEEVIKSKKKDKKDKKKKDNELDDNQQESKEADVSDNDDELSMNSRRIVKVTESMHKLSAEDLEDSEQMIVIIDDSKIDHGITNDFAFYVALVGLFPPNRNILKNWAKNQDVFVNLVKQEG